MDFCDVLAGYVAGGAVFEPIRSSLPPDMIHDVAGGLLFLRDRVSGQGPRSEQEPLQQFPAHAVARARDLSANGRVAYLLLEDLGIDNRMTSQLCEMVMVWEHGRCLYHGVDHAVRVGHLGEGRTVNEALAMLGVASDGQESGFSASGLRRLVIDALGRGDADTPS